MNGEDEKKNWKSKERKFNPRGDGGGIRNFAIESKKKEEEDEAGLKLILEEAKHSKKLIYWKIDESIWQF